MAKHGKKYLAAAAKIDEKTYYEPRKALELVKETSYSSFDATVEVHMRMGLDPRQADQMVRDVVVLPNGLGKTVRVLVFAQAEGATRAQEAGADYVADSDEWIAKIQGGWTDFDVAIATPDMMGKAGRLGRVLGPRGLMPNPKAGTVVPAEDLPRVIREAKAGRVEFRLDKTANIHVPIGKTSFEVEKLYENFATLMDAIKKARPSAARGTYIRRVTITATMGPGVKVDALAAQNM
ncbi:MAG TPA: 50S ribosomal protein L1 [Anaerolineaceae bacterium]|jgi:large subunit ribosomal protein L1|nr:50S ribosomal protein L1 [Anaerolineaceae bacterium]NMD31915.1 50S ribosomal protein L1 [Chloroflexota bacterium]HNZ01490.1 50S ribosomal protein L1 [Anaerolineaceae bacterium]HOD43427.1 50S ribosomal protein L1 [Anaerolineaceae bacterium]HOH20282.1 50S ribosomal protein L1 [Anaerolineaceae bacterium]